MLRLRIVKGAFKSWSNSIIINVNLNKQETMLQCNGKTDDCKNSYAKYRIWQNLPFGESISIRPLLKNTFLLYICLNDA